MTSGGSGKNSFFTKSEFKQRKGGGGGWPNDWWTAGAFQCAATAHYPVLTVGQVVVDSVTDPGLVVRIRTEEVAAQREERQESGQVDMRVDVTVPMIASRHSTEPMIATCNTEQLAGPTTEEVAVSSSWAGAAELGFVGSRR